MSPQDVRKTLIERVIAVIANDGLDKATTKAITAGTGINEAYIYRYFSGKEDLLAKAFDYLDEDLYATAIKYIDVMYMTSLEYELRCRVYFSAVWECLLSNREECLAFVRYYYSTYFARNSAQTHEKRFAPLVARFKNAFKDEADVWMILNHILNVMLDFAVKVHNDQMPRDDDYAEHVFRVIYRSVEQYFRNPKESDC